MSFAKTSPFSWLALSIGAIVAFAFGNQAFAQVTPRINAGRVQITGVPEDWASHHVVFSDPGTEEAAIKAGRYEKWLKTVNDPRYLMQQLKRNGTVRGPFADDAAYVQHLKAEFMQPRRPITREPVRGKKPAISPPSNLKSDWSVGLSTSTVMPSTFPAKYSFAPIGAPNCISDFVAYPTGATGSAGAATIVAFDELYPGASPGCGTSGVPAVYWAYNTTIAVTAPGAVTTSPVLSMDGTKIAYIQSDGNSVNLIILKTSPAGGESMTSPVSITSASANLGCTAPCMTVTNLNGEGGANSDTFSSPYYDYTNDILYVGDDNGFLYQISPVFNSTSTAPAVTAVSTGFFHLITSPVYDNVSGCVFVGDSGGFIFSFNSGVSGGTVCTGASFLLAATSLEFSEQHDGGFHDGFLLDPIAGEIYGFLSSGGSLAGQPCGEDINCVVQLPTNFANGAGPSGSEAIGVETFGNYIYSGAFDNVYYSSTNSASPSGNIYVVGDVTDYASANLYQVPIVSNVLGTPVATSIGFHDTVNNSTPNFATPVTEFCNNGGSPCAASGGATTSGTDTIYFSINQGSQSGCNSLVTATGCVVAYNVTAVNLVNPPFLTGSIDYAFPTESGGISGCWGTSAIIIDNDSTSTGASEVYYMYFGGNLPTTTANTEFTCGTSTGGTAHAIQTLQGTL